VSRSSLIAGLAGGLTVCGLSLLPLIWPGYQVSLLTVIFYWIGLAGCWNLMCGQTGYIDFGSAAYTGLGAYLAGLLCLRLQTPLPLSLLLAGLGAAGLAWVVGWPTLRLRGAYFAIATLALAETLKLVAEEWTSLTEGGLGLTFPVRLGELTYYWLYLGLAAVVIGLTWFITQAKHGYALKAIRENETAAAQVGVNTHLIKVKTYTLSAFFIGLLGAVEGSRMGYFKPEDVFNVHITIKMVIMTLLGGLGSILAPVIGASFLQIIEDVLGARFTNFYLVVVGFVIIVVIIFLPKGIGGSWAARPGRLFRRSK